ncbi:SDR family oxidoreductase [Streptomyces sp. FXJ1.4098]|nr:SDR family oxidoreductase [Streptomyces sp. FXJ1.4098]
MCSPTPGLAGSPSAGSPPPGFGPYTPRRPPSHDPRPHDPRPHDSRPHGPRPAREHRRRGPGPGPGRPRPRRRPAVDGPAGACPPRRILLTGATGFLGGHMLLDLLRYSDAHVYCLIRAADEEEATSRLGTALAGFALPWSSEIRRRVTVLPGDLRRPASACRRSAGRRWRRSWTRSSAWRRRWTFCAATRRCGRAM